MAITMQSMVMYNLAVIPCMQTREMCLLFLMALSQDLTKYYQTATTIAVGQAMGNLKLAKGTCHFYLGASLEGLVLEEFQSKQMMACHLVMVHQRPLGMEKVSQVTTHLL
jgi:hypothetical protein